MLAEQNQTIAAIATPQGMGGIGVIRISGPQAHAIACSLNAPPAPPRSARYARFYDGRGEVIDDGIILWFPGPRSFTGEDVVELHVLVGQRSELHQCLPFLGGLQSQQSFDSVQPAKFLSSLRFFPFTLGNSVELEISTDIATIA